MKEKIDQAIVINDINQMIDDLFPLNRSLTGNGNWETLKYLQKNILKDSEIKKISSGSQVFDWTIPPEWNVYDAYVKNKHGKKIIDFKENNIHLVSYSEPFHGVLGTSEFLKHLYTLPKFPDRIPYRTSYYSRKWAFCCAHNLLSSNEFKEPFEVRIDSEFKEDGKLIWLEAYKKGKVEEEILISSYFCHPSLANDNVSGFVSAALLFNYLQSIDTKFSYRLVIVPETIGAIAFLSTADVEKIIGGMILSCVGGPDKLSIKEGFNSDHWINKAAHYALRKYTNNNYITYPFAPMGSDERQYSTPKFRIVTPSIHKSKYHEYDQYHTSADNQDFISSENIYQTMEVHRLWIQFIESYSFPKEKIWVVNTNWERGACIRQWGEQRIN